MTTVTLATFSATGTGDWIAFPFGKCAFQGVLSTTTTPAATVEIYGSNDNTTTPASGILLGTLVMSGSGDPASLTKSDAEYPYKCAKCTAISGTSAVATITVSSTPTQITVN